MADPIRPDPNRVKNSWPGPITISNPTKRNLNFAQLYHEIVKKLGFFGTFQSKVDEICTFFWLGRPNQSDVLKIGLDLTESDPTSDLQYIMGQYNFLTQL